MKQNVKYLTHITVHFLNSYLHEISNEIDEINYLVVRELATKSIESKTMKSVNVLALDQNWNMSKVSNKVWTQTR